MTSSVIDPAVEPPFDTKSWSFIDSSGGVHPGPGGQCFDLKLGNIVA